MYPHLYIPLPLFSLPDEDLDDIDLDDLSEEKKQQVLDSIRQGGGDKGAEVAESAGTGTTLGGIMESAQQAVGGLVKGWFGKNKDAGGGEL